MMRRRTSSSSRALVLLLLCLLAGCDRPQQVSQPAAPRSGPAVQQSAAAASSFRAPGTDGWGMVDGLHFQEFVVGGGRADQALPMLVMIHGMGDQPGEHWLRLFRAVGPLRIIMPRAPRPYGSGFSWFEYRVGDNEPVALGQGIAAEADHLARALPVLVAERPTVGLPLVAGFSQGGMLSFALAVRHPQRLALAVPISGTLPAPIWPAARDADAANPPIRALHGTTDTVVPIAPTQELVAHLERQGYDATLRIFEGVGHVITADMQAALDELLPAGAPP